MKNILKYSVLRYIPSRMIGEAINLGILFSDELTGYHVFKHTQNYNRITSFDDEINKKSIMLFLDGIEQEVLRNEYNDSFDINGFIKYYINNFKFERPISIEYEDLDAIQEELFGLYFRHDLEKEKRPSRDSDQKLLKRIIVASGMNVEKNNRIVGAFNENISYDIITDDYYVKLFDFDKKNLKRTISFAKAWAWNCNQETRKPTYIVYRYNENELNKKDFEIIRRIFESSNAKFCSIEEGIELFRNAG